MPTALLDVGRWISSAPEPDVGYVVWSVCASSCRSRSLTCRCGAARFLRRRASAVVCSERQRHADHEHAARPPERGRVVGLGGDAAQGDQKEGNALSDDDEPGESPLSASLIASVRTELA
eukprot:3256320-Rhodomonas_salina.3